MLCEARDQISLLTLNFGLNNIWSSGWDRHRHLAIGSDHLRRRGRVLYDRLVVFRNSWSGFLARPPAFLETSSRTRAEAFESAFESDHQAAYAPRFKCRPDPPGSPCLLSLDFAPGCCAGALAPRIVGLLVTNGRRILCVLQPVSQQCPF